MERRLLSIERQLDGIAFLIAEQALLGARRSPGYALLAHRTDRANREMRAIHQRVSEHLASGRTFEDLLLVAEASDPDEILQDHETPCGFFGEEIRVDDDDVDPIDYWHARKSSEDYCCDGGLEKEPEANTSLDPRVAEPSSSCWNLDRSRR